MIYPLPISPPSTPPEYCAPNPDQLLLDSAFLDYTTDAHDIHGGIEVLPASTTPRYPSSPTLSWTSRSTKPYPARARDLVMNWSQECMAQQASRMSDLSWALSNTAQVNVYNPLYISQNFADCMAPTYTYHQPGRSSLQSSEAVEEADKILYRSEPVPTTAMQHFPAARNALEASEILTNHEDSALAHSDRLSSHVDLLSESIPVGQPDPNEPLVTSRRLVPVEMRDIEAGRARVAAMDTVPRRRHHQRSSNTIYSRLRCDDCGHRFKRPYNYAKHMIIHNPRREKPFACEETGCSQPPFARAHDLQRHLDTVRSLWPMEIVKLMQYRSIDRTDHTVVATVTTEAEERIL
jgi:hypothetical protein